MGKKNLVTVLAYADMCDVTAAAIYMRARNSDVLKIQDVEGPGGIKVKCIDTEKFPPMRYRGPKKEK